METDSISDNQNDLKQHKLEHDTVDTKIVNQIGRRASLSLKKQPELLCNCPLHCNSKIGKDWRKTVYKQFQDIGDHALQNQYIQRHIKIKGIAKRLWEEDTVEKKIQKRVTCKYLIPVTGSVSDSFSYSKTLTYDSVIFALDTSWTQENSHKPDPLKDLLNTCKQASLLPDTLKDLLSASKMKNSNSENSKDLLNTSKITNCFLETSTDSLDNSKINNSHTDNLTLQKNSVTDKILPNGISEDVNEFDSLLEYKRSENAVKDVTSLNSPLSLNDTDSVNTSPDDTNNSELENNSINPVKYIEVCQKAFMNMYGITEKRVRWQREKLILKARILAEKKREELEEMDRTLSLARSLGAGCQPLFALLEKSNCSHLYEQLMGAIEDDVALVNNFFHNQLWKPEDIMNKTIQESSLDMDSLELERI